MREREIDREREIGLQRWRRSSATVTRLFLGGSRTRSVLGGDDENEMQGSDLDGGDIEEEERKKRKLGRRVIWAVGQCDLGGGATQSGLARAWLGWPKLG